jgi:hypothetical protein
MDDGAKIGLTTFDNKLQIGYFSRTDYITSQGYQKKIFGDGGSNCCVSFLDMQKPNVDAVSLRNFMNSWNGLWGDNPFSKDVLLTEPPVVCEQYAIINVRTGSQWYTTSIALRQTANFKELAKGNIAFADLLLTHLRYVIFPDNQPWFEMLRPDITNFLEKCGWSLNYRIESNIEPIVRHPINKQLKITGFEQYAYWVFNRWHDFTNYLYYNRIPKII